jgi:hypothetical protein
VPSADFPPSHLLPKWTLRGANDREKLIPEWEDSD